MIPLGMMIQRDYFDPVFRRLPIAKPRIRECYSCGRSSPAPRCRERRGAGSPWTTIRVWLERTRIATLLDEVTSGDRSAQRWKKLDRGGLRVTCLTIPNEPVGRGGFTQESNTAQSITVNRESNWKKRKFPHGFRSKTNDVRLPVSKKHVAAAGHDRARRPSRKTRLGLPVAATCHGTLTVRVTGSLSSNPSFTVTVSVRAPAGAPRSVVNFMVRSTAM